MKRGLRLFLLRWHRRLGATVCVFVVVLVLTGIALNHSGGLRLDKTPVRSGLLLALYGIETPELRTWNTSLGWAGHAGAPYLHFNQREVAYCELPVNGVLAWQNMLLALCADELLMLTASGDVIERVGPVLGLPQGTSKIGVGAAGQLLLQAKGQSYRVDPEQLRFEMAASSDSPRWATAEIMPESLADDWRQTLTGAGISRERLLLDIHSGRILGPWGVYIVDGAALLFLLIALSGVWVWLTSKRR